MYSRLVLCRSGFLRQLLILSFYAHSHHEGTIYEYGGVHSDAPEGRRHPGGGRMEGLAFE
jgi:hypothetical protein